MGRERYWGGRSKTTRRGERESPGCMSSVLQFFDFHQFQFALHQPSFKTHSFLQVQEDSTVLQGVEAPRNSLESQESPYMETVPLSSIMKEEDLNVQMKIRLEPKLETPKRGVGEGSESTNSPGTKTPSLVARLMGLDLLPDTLSPSSSSIHARASSRGKPYQRHLPERSARSALGRELRSRQPLCSRSNSNINFMESEVRYEITGSHSLPNTPRISSARRSDVDPRLSLQINKENLIPSEEFDYFARVSKNSFLCSPYASSTTKSRKKELRHTEIVKQVKESVRRRVGRDITNTTRSTASQGEGLTIKSQKANRLTKVGEESSSSKHSTPSCSPRLRFLEPKNKPVMIHDQTSRSPKPLWKDSKPRSPSPPLQPTQAPLSLSKSVTSNDQPEVPAKEKAQALHQLRTKCRKGGSERFTERLKKPPHVLETIRNRGEEAFVRASTATKASLSDKKCRKTPISNDLVNIGLPSLVPFKKKQFVSAPQAPVVQSSCSSQTYNNNINSSRTGAGADFRYITHILNRTGIGRDALVSITRWFSPCHPLDPSIFHHLERSFPDSSTNHDTKKEDHLLGSLSLRSNRKLLFDLVDEILVVVLKPYLNLKPWLSSSNNGSPKMTGSQLLERLWSEIRGFPAADCRTLQDIDALVEKDLPEGDVRTVVPLSEEAESIVFEIERDILDSLFHETAAAVVFPRRRQDHKMTSRSPLCTETVANDEDRI